MFQPNSYSRILSNQTRCTPSSRLVRPGNIPPGQTARTGSAAGGCGRIMGWLVKRLVGSVRGDELERVAGLHHWDRRSGTSPSERVPHHGEPGPQAQLVATGLLVETMAFEPAVDGSQTRQRSIALLPVAVEDLDRWRSGSVRSITGRNAGRAPSRRRPAPWGKRCARRSGPRRG